MGFPIGSRHLLHPSLILGKPHCGVTHQPWTADAGHQTTAALDAPQKLPLCASTMGMVTQGPVNCQPFSFVEFCNFLPASATVSQRRASARDCLSGPR